MFERARDHDDANNGDKMEGTPASASGGGPTRLFVVLAESGRTCCCLILSYISSIFHFLVFSIYCPSLLFWNLLLFVCGLEWCLVLCLFVVLFCGRRVRICFSVEVYFRVKAGASPSRHQKCVHTGLHECIACAFPAVLKHGTIIRRIQRLIVR